MFVDFVLIITAHTFQQGAGDPESGGARQRSWLDRWSEFYSDNNPDKQKARQFIEQDQNPGDIALWWKGQTVCGRRHIPRASATEQLTVA